MAHRHMKMRLGVSALAAGLIASGAARAQTIQVGEGFFQTTPLDVRTNLPDAAIKKSALAVSSKIMSDSVALPTSAWFSSFLR